MRAVWQSRNRPKAVFIWIPKTAGTSIWLALNAPKLKTMDLVRNQFTNRGTVTFGHMDYSKLVSEGYVNKAFDASSFKFTFVRNPYDRAVSLYTYLQQEAKKIPEDESFLDFWRKVLSTGCCPIGLYNQRELSQCNPQVRWVENVSVDYIGRFESVEKDLGAISSKLGLDIGDIAHANRSNHSDYRDYYCTESKEIIQEFYKEDFVAFDYDQEMSLDS